MKVSGRSLGFAVLCLAACWLLVDLHIVKGPLHAMLAQGRGVIAEVHGRPVLGLELEQALRSHLWVSGTSWASLDADARQSTRALVLEKLIDAHLVRAARLQESPAEPPPPPARFRLESDMHHRQFAAAEEFPQRLAAQRHTQKSFNASIQEAQLDEAWLAKKIAPSEVTDREARAWYDEFKETLRIPQAHRASHIFLAGGGNNKAREAEIRQIHRRLLANEKPFATLAASHSEDARNKAHGGDLGWFTRQRMPADFIAAVEKLPLGQLSAPISTRLGWHIIIVRGRHPSRLPTFADAKAEITALLTTRRRTAALKNLLATLRQQTSESVVYHVGLIRGSAPSS